VVQYFYLFLLKAVLGKKDSTDPVCLGVKIRLDKCYKTVKGHQEWTEIFSIPCKKRKPVTSILISYRR
jgi:hypothetical protein